MYVLCAFALELLKSLLLLNACGQLRYAFVLMRTENYTIINLHCNADNNNDTP